MDNGLNYGLPKHRKIIETGMLAIGFILFVILSAQGIQAVDDRRAIAGQNRSIIANVDNDYVLPFSKLHEDTLLSTVGNVISGSQGQKPDTSEEKDGKSRADEVKNTNAANPELKSTDVSPKKPKTPAAS